MNLDGFSVLSGDPLTEVVQNELCYRQIVEILPVALYACDLNGRIILYNEAAVALWGKRPVLGKDLWCGSFRIFSPHGSEIPLEQCPMARTLRECRPIRGEEIIVERPDGIRRNILPHPELIRSKAGVVVGAINMLVDITDHKHAQLELAKTKDDLALQVAALRHLHELAMRLGDFSDLRPALEAILKTIIKLHGADFGYLSLFDPASGFLCNAASIGFDEEALSYVSQLIPRVGAGACGTAFSTGQRVVVEDTEEDQYFQDYREFARLIGFRAVHSTPILTRAGEILGVLSVHFEKPCRPTERERQLADLCARHAADTIDAVKSQQALRNSEERFRLMANSSPTLIWLAAPDNRRNWFNKSWLQFTGRSIDEERDGGWTEGMHTDDREKCMRIYSSAMEARREFRLEYRLRRYDGQYRWVLDQGMPLQGSTERFVGYIGSCIDITDQVLARQMLEQQQASLEEAVRVRTAELDRSNQRLRLAERMASLGTLSAGLGHDMGNVLLPVRIYLENLARADLSDELKRDIEKIRTASDYLQRLANGLRLMALDPERSQIGEPTELESWWQDAALVMKNGLPRGVTLESCFSQGCWTTMSKTALTQAVFNLVQNAGEAMRQRGSGTVRVSGKLEGDSVVVKVEDNGPGMTTDVRNRCMEPFFTTKTRSISTGLGLVLVNGLVREAGGSVDVVTEVGKGTVFTLHLCVFKPSTMIPHGRQKHAIVNLKDHRMQSFVTAELRALSFNVLPAKDSPDPLDVLVIEEDPVLLEKLKAQRVVIFGDTDGDKPDRAIVIGRKPKPEIIRKALRTAAREIEVINV